MAAASVAALSGALSGPASAAVTSAAATGDGATGDGAVSPHVVVVGISGLRWTDLSAARTPALWDVTSKGSPGSLVDYAVLPHTCPADGWLTLNAGDRAQARHGNTGTCPALPAVTSQPSQPGVPSPARVAAMPSLVSYSNSLRYSAHWGLLASAAGKRNCATAVGPGAALALAGPGGNVGSYLPGASDLSRQVLARCPLTVASSSTGANWPSTRSLAREAAS